jgi:hypothetical protein
MHMLIIYACCVWLMLFIVTTIDLHLIGMNSLPSVLMMLFFLLGAGLSATGLIKKIFMKKKLMFLLFTVIWLPILLVIIIFMLVFKNIYA